MRRRRGQTHLSKVADEGAASSRSAEVDTVARSGRADLCRWSSQVNDREKSAEPTANLAGADVGVLVAKAVAERVVVVADDLAASGVAVASHTAVAWDLVGASVL